MPSLVIGLTIVAIGTSAPEMLVSSMAAVMGNPSLGIGNAIGSNITNVALVLGLTALVAPLSVHSKLIRREIPVLLVTMLATFVMLWYDSHLGRLDGALLLGGMFLMVGWVAREGLQEGARDDALASEFDSEVPEGMKVSTAVGWFLVGLLVLLGSSRLLVWGAIEIAQSFGVPELVIGLTIVAFGTSLPELAASIVAATRNEHDIAVGNVVGSNMFNLLGVLGLPGVIAPSACDHEVITRDFPVMGGVTLLLFAMARGFGERGRLGRVKGSILLLCFFAYLVWLYIHSTAL